MNKEILLKTDGELLKEYLTDDEWDRLNSLSLTAINTDFIWQSLTRLIRELHKAEEKAKSLWGLLDHISTLDDAYREHDADFRKQAYKVCEKRNKYFVSDGYNLFEPNQEQTKLSIKKRTNQMSKNRKNLKVSSWILILPVIWAVMKDAWIWLMRSGNASESLGQGFNKDEEQPK